MQFVLCSSGHNAEAITEHAGMSSPLCSLHERARARVCVVTKQFMCKFFLSCHMCRPAMRGR